jgi:hypothetical protein
VGCGLSWKASQVKIVSRPDGPRGYGFIEDESEATRPARSSAPSSGPTSGHSSKAAAFAAAFDEEEDEEVEAEQAEAEEEVLKAAAPVAARVAQPAEDHAPVAPPKKKVVQKKLVGGLKA